MSIYVIKSRLEKDLEKIERELALNQIDILHYTNLDNTQILQIQQSKVKREIWEKSKETTIKCEQLVDQIIIHYDSIRILLFNIQTLLIEASTVITQLRRDEISSLILADLNSIDTLIDQTIYNETKVLYPNIIAVNVGETPYFDIISNMNISPTYDNKELLTIKLNSISTINLGISGLLMNDVSNSIESKEKINDAIDNIMKYKLDLTSFNKTLEAAKENQDLHMLYYTNLYNKLVQIDTVELNKRKNHIKSLLNNIDTIVKNSTVLPINSLPYTDL